MTTPRVSVLMMFHRVTPFLRPAVASVLQQTWPNLELVLVDNGTGAGLQPLGEYGADPRIRLVSQATNLGIAAATNAALARATGEFIALLDHDDIALPRRLELQVAALNADPALGLVSSWAEQIDANGRVIGREFALTEPRAQFVFSGYTNPAPAPSHTARRCVFERFPWRAEFTCAGDYDFFARAAEAWAMRAVPEVLLQYRCHPGQATRERHSAQVCEAAVARLLTARRRAGRPENFPQLVGEVRGWLDRPPPPAITFEHFARRCLQEGFPLLAVYHARKLLSQERAPAAVARALRIVTAAIRLAPGETGTLLRMFATGPLRTHGLRPA